MCFLHFQWARGGCGNLSACCGTVVLDGSTMGADDNRRHHHFFTENNERPRDRPDSFSPSSIFRSIRSSALATRNSSSRGAGSRGSAAARAFSSLSTF